jgi:acyl-CoA synthetase (NDP forming)
MHLPWAFEIMAGEGLEDAAAAFPAPPSPRAASPFVHEGEAYRLLEDAGLVPPLHGWVGEVLPFLPGDGVVVKGLGDGLWHKSELGAVRMMDFDLKALDRAAREMRDRIEGEGHAWVGALVCQRIPIARAEGLPSEAFVSLTRGDGGWTLVLGIGGLQAEALGALAPPLRLPLSATSQAEALAALEGHLLGRVWLGTLRGTRPLTGIRQLRLFIDALWRAADLAEVRGLKLLEMNPVALDDSGDPRPLDAVGLRAEGEVFHRQPPPPGFLEAILSPQTVALAGVSSQAGTVGRIILDNLRRRDWERLVIVKPGQEAMLGLPCVPDVTALKQHPVDLLLLALPAPAAAKTLLQLLDQGGGAKVVGLVSGGLGDGADTEGLGAKLSQALHEAREMGCWTPAVLGPNFLGHWVPQANLDSSFIAGGRLPAMPAQGGPLALLSQSGAFLITRRSRMPQLPFGLAQALGNQMDVALPDLLEALAERPEFGAIAAYLEGFGPGHLAATAHAVARLAATGRRPLLLRAGRTAEGQAAAASHTGALAGDAALEEALLRRAGARWTTSQAAFDAGLAWLGAFPKLAPGPVALVTNAGFESVGAGDAMEAPLRPAAPDEALSRDLSAILTEEGLGGLVAPRLPLDLTPMAPLRVFGRCAARVLDSEAAILVVGIVPFALHLGTEDLEATRAFSRDLMAQALARGKALAFAVDAGPDFEAYRDALASSGAPVFLRVEDALEGLKALA